MSIKLPWVEDPKDNVESVSLSFCVVFGLAALVLNILKATGNVNDTASLNELFWGSMALYFGRRNINIGGKMFGAEKAESLEGKVSS